MAAPDPKNPTPTQPDKLETIPVASLTLKTGLSVQWPGRTHATGSVAATEAVPQQFWKIDLVPRLRQFRVAWYAAGPDLARPPTAIRMVPESWASWVPA